MIRGQTWEVLVRLAESSTDKWADYLLRQSRLLPYAVERKVIALCWLPWWCCNVDCVSGESLELLDAVL